MKIKTADLCDEFFSKISIVDPMFSSFGKRKSFFGPIATVQVNDDNVLVRELLETLPSGSVLVVDGMASKNCALLGGNLASIAASRGIAGIIVNGYIRDTTELCKANIGVLALGSVPLKSRKEGKGEENVTLRFGGIQWKPNSIVYADEDGIVVATECLEVP